MTLLLAALLCGDCQQRVVVKQQVAKVQAFAYAPVQTQVYAYAQVPLYDPQWYVVGESARLRKLEEIVERQQVLAEQQAQAIELLRGAASAAGAGNGESALAVEARRILAVNCMSCHSGAEIKGGVDLSGALDLPTKLLIAEVVGSGVMPPTPKEPLSDQDAATIAAWATEDKKAVREFLKAQRGNPPLPGQQ